LLGGLVTVIAVVGHHSLYRPAAQGGVGELRDPAQYPEVVMPPKGRAVALWRDTAL